MSKPPTIKITVEFTGGLEMLFSNQHKHAIEVSATTTAAATTTTPSRTFPAAEDSLAAVDNGDRHAFTIKDLIAWLCENLMRDPRKELFVLDGSIRPGILVLINDADWELEGEDAYELKEGDCILFVSTLHGG